MTRKINPYAQYFTPDEITELKKLKVRISRNLIKCSYMGPNFPELRREELDRATNFLESSLAETQKYFEKISQLVPELTRKEFNFYFL